MKRESANLADAARLAREVKDTPLKDAVAERYLSYALSTIIARSLPDVRDGLKPVHRRLLYAMRALRLAPNEPPKKSARVVGDVIGKFHPHGDVAVYDALVRLAQDFAQRYPLVDGQGNFGNIDGDNAAAMRYTEARLTAVAELLLQDMDAGTVDFRPTYDASGEEPLVLPAAFPNLLANGATGIAVGMATSIPPHNADEVIAALRHLIAHPNASLDKILSLMPGPDFPTGGVIVEDKALIREAYETGRGGFRVRARWTVEELPRGAYQIVVTEIPWQVAKARLVERIAELLLAKKLPLLEDVRDESAEDVRLVLVPKNRSVAAETVMASLFRQTELEARIGLNMNVLDAGGTPQLMGLKAVLRAFLDHRMVVLVRRSRHRLSQIEARLEILDGFLIAYLNLDAVIRIIRNEDEPKPILMKKFTLSDTQAEAVLNLRLRALRKLEEMEIKQEHKKLSAERAELNRLLKEEDKRWSAIDAELAEVQKAFGKKTPLGKRRSQFGEAPAEAEEDFAPEMAREPITVLLSDKGWVRSFKGHVTDLSSIPYKEGDREKFVLHAETTDRILLFGTNGRSYTLEAHKLPSGRGHGEPVRLMIDLANDADILAAAVFVKDARYLVAATDGRGFIVAAEDMAAETRKGRQVLTVDPPVEAAVCRLVTGDHVAVIGTHRKLLIFPLEQVPVMGKGKGVILQKHKEGQLSDAVCFTLKEGLRFLAGGKEKRETDLRPWLGDRAQTGRLPPNGFPKSNRFS